MVLDPEWTFTASVTTPEGARVEAAISVPTGWTKDPHSVGELSEVTHMCVASAIKYILPKEARS